eukprot:13908021-Alexandrium_andersonii.AAC.1
MYVQATRRHAPVHVRDPDLLSHTLCGWHFAANNAHRLLADTRSTQPRCVCAVAFWIFCGGFVVD